MRTKIINEQLKSHIISDLKLVDVPTDFNLEFRGYSDSYWGRYYTKQKKIVVFVLSTKDGQAYYPYSTILNVVLHEATHHYQYTHEDGFKRAKGIMHNPNFNRFYSQKVYKLKELEVIDENEELV